MQSFLRRRTIALPRRSAQNETLRARPCENELVRIESSYRRGGAFYPATFGATIGNDLNLRVRELTGSSEFTTWVALAGAAILGGLCAIYSSNPWVLIAAALIGAVLGYKGDQIGRRYLERYLSQRRSR